MASGEVSAGVVGEGDAGGDAFADRLALDFEALGDGHDDFQTVLSDAAGVGGSGHRQDGFAVPGDDFHQVPARRSCVRTGPGGVLAGIGDQLADVQLGQVHGAR
ncbi:hypothetical protein [Streptomyces sp. NBC_01314]|uniref:hypothetical protein n=1 Tax=Streptomyces sp. NBC_01314 TaxID=2903821 RepID=UPI00352D670E